MILKKTACCIFAAFTLIFAGCEVDELINKITRDVYRSPARISVLVFMPIPAQDNIVDSELMRSVQFARRVEAGMKEGVNKFNERSRGTELIPIYYTTPDAVIDFYDSFLAVAKTRNLRKLSAFCRQWLDEVNRSDTRYNASCIIFGFFIGREGASSAKLDIRYYDSAKDDISKKPGVIPLDGRGLQEALQETLLDLLKEVYE